MAPKLSPADCAALFAKADAAGKAAAFAKIPVPMIVSERVNPLDDSSPIKKSYAPVMGGICGSAYVRIKPGNSAFANWMKKRGYARSDDYYGGICMSVAGYGQSFEKKYAYAGAFAQVVEDAGFRAYADEWIN
jgi:hypothetical protein